MITCDFTFAKIGIRVVVVIRFTSASGRVPVVVVIARIVCRILVFIRITFIFRTEFKTTGILPRFVVGRICADFQVDCVESKVEN